MYLRGLDRSGIFVAYFLMCRTHAKRFFSQTTCMNPRKGTGHTGSHARTLPGLRCGTHARGIGASRVPPELCYHQAAPGTDTAQPGLPRTYALERGRSSTGWGQATANVNSLQPKGSFTYPRGRPHASGGPAGMKPYVSSTDGSCAAGAGHGGGGNWRPQGGRGLVSRGCQ